MTKSIDELYKAQLELEDFAKDWSKERYSAKCVDAEGKRLSEALLAPGFTLLRRLSDTLGQAIQRRVYEDSLRGSFVPSRKWIRNECTLDSYELAYLTLRSGLTASCSGTAYQGACEQLGANIVNEMHARQLREEHPALYGQLVDKEWKDMPKWRVFRELKLLKADLKMPKLIDPESSVKLGKMLYDLAEDVGGLWDLKRISGNRSPYKLVPTQKLTDYLQAGHEQALALTPVYLPMVIPPLSWSTNTDGGYLNHTYNLIRKHCGVAPKAVLESLNKIQSVPWRINKPILELITLLYKGGSALGGMPSFEELTPSPWGDWEDTERGKKEYPEEFRIWSRGRAMIHQANNTARSKAVALSMQLRVAEKFKDYERIYFPHFLDFRGRVYPKPLFLNPQGDSKAKAILEYAEGKPLDTLEAREWFYIHGANVYGVDKVSFGDRLTWVGKHQAQIMDSAKNPLDGMRFWTEADSPFQFLAWCFEYAEFVQDPDNFLSRIPVAMDGTCSGLQHYSALLKDSKGAGAVNLLYSDKPNDIYAEVAQLCATKVDAKLNDSSVYKSAAKGKDVTHKQLARLWHGKIDRTAAKHNTMTVPYGVTKRGMSDQLVTLLSKGKIGPIATDDVWTACSWLAELMYESIGELVQSAESGKQFLTDVAKIVSKEGKDVYWTTPMGLRVKQYYRTWKTKRLDFVRSTARIALSIRTGESGGVDARRASQGTSPNFIHSLDASHLMMTVNAMPEDSHMCVIHDSFAVHARDIPTLRDTLKQTFTELYASKNWLEEFLEDQKVLCPEVKDWPELPPVGDLDISSIMESCYIFS